MTVDVVLLPELAKPGDFAGKTVVIFDVLRATTTMTAALAAGVREIRVQPSLEAALAAARAFDGDKILCGESKCLKPAGFDLGNSPGAFDPRLHQGKVAFMATTNGTKAILAAEPAAQRFIGALVNARSVGRATAAQHRDVVLLCAGTEGAVAMEDLIGAGAVVEEIIRCGGDCASDTARIARRVWQSAREDLYAALADAKGGRNVIAAGLGDDVRFAARADVIDIVGRVVQRDRETVVESAQWPEIAPAG